MLMPHSCLVCKSLNHTPLLQRSMQVLLSLKVVVVLPGATDIITANTEVATEMGSQLLSYLGANANGVRVLVRELRKQMENHVVELAEELLSDTQHLPKDPDGYVYKVDQSLLSSAVRPPPCLSVCGQRIPSLWGQHTSSMPILIGSWFPSCNSGWVASTSRPCLRDLARNLYATFRSLHSACSVWHGCLS